MARVPGIVYVDGAVGRRAHVAGTGLDVFEVIKEYLACDRDRKALREAFHWLKPKQLQAALNFYATFPAEIDERLRREDELEQRYMRAKGPIFPRP